MKSFTLILAILSGNVLAANNRDKATQTAEQCVVIKALGKNDSRNTSTKIPCTSASKDKANGGSKR